LRIAALTVDAGVGNISVTVSIGLAEVTADDRDVEDTIARADQALYIAKSSGRNRVCVDYPTPRSQSA